MLPLLLFALLTIISAVSPNTVLVLGLILFGWFFGAFSIELMKGLIFWPYRIMQDRAHAEMLAMLKAARGDE